MGLRILGSVTATLMVAVTGILAAPAVANAVPAQAAAACRTSSGVTAIVDFDELGGGVTAGCDSNGGGQAASQVFRDAGYTLEYSQQPGMNGFVCKIQSKPADGDCAANDAFWSLWWSDGRSGRWVFSSQGVGTIDVPDGGYVAFAWHEGGGRAEPPAVNPTPHIQPVEPSDDPSDNDGGNGGNGGATQQRRRRKRREQRRQRRWIDHCRTHHLGSVVDGHHGYVIDGFGLAGSPEDA